MSFKLTIPIEHCYVQKSHDEFGNEVETKRITGIASGTELDRDTEKMAESALYAMRKSIDEGILNEHGELVQVPLYSEHRKEALEQLGWLTKAWIQKSDTGEHQLWIEAELDDDNPKSTQLYKKLTTPNPKKGRPTKLGLSISGKVLSAYKQFDPSIKKAVTVFEQIALNEVSVVTKPAYVGSYLDILEKSYKEDTGDDLSFRGEHSMDDLTNKAEAQNETPSDDTEKSSVTDTQEQAPIADATEKATSNESSGDVTKAFEIRFEGIEKQIGGLAQLMEEMKVAWATLTVDLTQKQTDPVKSEQVEESTDDVVKTEAEVSDDSVNVLKSAVADAIQSQLNPVLEKMTALEQTVEQLGKPVDKSFSVLGEQGDISGRDLYEARKAAARAEGRQFDPIGEGIRAAFARKQ